MLRVFIDDTGSPGVVTESVYDSKDATTWVAVIFDEEHYQAAVSMMSHLLGYVKNIGAKEFHFKDIFQGKGEFKQVGLDERLEIVKIFSSYFKKMQFPIFVQTVAPEDYLRSGLNIDDPKFKKDNFKISDSSDLALLALLLRVKHYLITKYTNKELIEIVIDSGRQKGGTTQKCSLFDPNLKNGVLRYEFSHHESLLQLADFAAFMINKQRLILTKTDRTPLDNTMWKYFADAKFNALNMVKKLVRRDADTVKINDQLIRDRYEQANLASNITLQDLINLYYQ